MFTKADILPMLLEITREECPQFTPYWQTRKCVSTTLHFKKREKKKRKCNNFYGLSDYPLFQLKYTLNHSFPLSLCQGAEKHWFDMKSTQYIHPEWHVPSALQTEYLRVRKRKKKLMFHLISHKHTPHFFC